MSILTHIYKVLGISLDKELFLTHTPLSYIPGTKVDGMIVTRQQRLADTALVGGGRIACWQIYGIPQKSTGELS